MNKKPIQTRKRKSLADILKRHTDELRKNYPHRFVTSSDNILFVENVARMLGCGVDHVRRIPKSELPVAKVGKRSTYLRSDVENYVRGLRSTKPLLPRSNSASQIIGEPVESGFNPVQSVRDDQE